MEACKEKNFLNIPPCPCQLCLNIEIPVYDRDNVDTYAMPYTFGGMIRAEDVEKLANPSLFCKYLEMWRSQFYACCCTGHDEPEDCKLNGKEPCDCPRCCSCMRKIERDSNGKKIDCYYCTKLKSKLFVPCKHHRGYCTD